MLSKRGNSHLKVNCYITGVAIMCLLMTYVRAPAPITLPPLTILANSNGTVTQQSLAAFGATDLLAITLNILSGPALTTTSLIANLNSQILPSSIDIQTFYHQDPNSINNYDLDAMWSAEPHQYINLHRNSQPTLFLTIIKQDPFYRQGDVSVQIVIQAPSTTTYSCAPCANGEIFGPNSCICRNCLFQKTGKRCSRHIQPLQTNSTAVQINPYQYKYYSIVNTNSISLSIGMSGGMGQAYLQFQQFPNEVASFFNVAKGTSDGRYLINNNVLVVGADTQQRPLMITLVCLSGPQCKANISYSEQSSVSVLVIVMAVLGGILLIALIIAIVCLVKRRNAVNSRISAEIQAESSKLSEDEIERYFPPCLYNEVVNYKTSRGSKILVQSSINPISVMSQEITKATDLDCVICLQPINYSDTIRIGFCKHIFHDFCLIGWFKKQRNCPYCRKQYNRDETVADYNKLVSQNNNRVLKNIDLAGAIYDKKVISKAVIQQNLD